MGFDLLVVGGGAQGRVISAFFARSSGCDSVRLCDINYRAVKQYARWLGSDKVSVFRVNAKHVEEIAHAARDSDIVVNAVLPRFNLNVMRAALRAGAHYLDLAFGPPYDNLNKQFGHNKSFEDAGLVAVTGSGKAPGLTNVLAAKAADELDRIENVFIRIYGSIESSEPIMTWSPRTLIEDCALKPVVLRGGKMIEVEPFSGEELYTFPVQSIGTKRVWNHLHEEVFMLKQTFFSKGLRNCDLKMGGIDQIKGLYELGLLSTQKVLVNGRRLSPLDTVASMLPKPPNQKELKAKIESGSVRGSSGCETVVVEGRRNGEYRKHILWISDPDIRNVVKHYPMATDDSYVVGISGAVMAFFVAEGKIKNPGVYTPEGLPKDIRAKYLRELARLQPPIEFRERIVLRETSLPRKNDGATMMRT